MKKIILISFILFVNFSWAGDKVGNGGGLWTCFTKDKEISHGVLVDLYEAKVEFGLNIPADEQSRPMDIVKKKADLLRFRDTYLYSIFSPEVDNVMQKIRLVSSELVVVDDALFRLKPHYSTCSMPWEYVQFANFTNLGQVLIREDLWNSSAISALDKAALVWHEAIYAWLRKERGDSDSVRARMIVGLIFSDMESSQFKNRIAKILKENQQPQPRPEDRWICLVENKHTSNWYGGYGINKLEASGNAKSSCQKEEYEFFCQDQNLRCEEIISESINNVCQVENHLHQKTYIGKGRNRLEAAFGALKACQAQPDSVSCSEPICQ